MAGRGKLGAGSFCRQYKINDPAMKTSDWQPLEI